MARPKKRVTENNFNLAYQYFRRLFDQRNLDRYEDALVNPDNRFKAEKALYKVLASDDANVKARAMQEWIDCHVSHQGIKWMWAALRQRTYQRKLKPAMLAMDPDIHYDLKQLAKRHKLTLSKMIKKLMGHYSDRGTESLILEKIRALPGATNDHLILFPKLRAKLSLSKADFDAAILSLIRADTLIPHRHIHPSRMTAQERVEMVTDGESWFCGFILNEGA